ncbi:hypothetical protein A3Q56_07018 [Intoshia linei]|uniref:U3 small nucleolar RNA-associated protein 14 A n=1 Tax=Intoshia linei TaxID=1819745 RepID=A0A177AUS4_9BILA|nr:hypothetical protein A3Q56_07018 [Intoshia linei]
MTDKHSKLLTAITELDSQNVKFKTRGKNTNDSVSNIPLDSKMIKLSKMINSVYRKTKSNKIESVSSKKRKLDEFNKKYKVVEKPMSTLESEKINRQVTYAKSQKKLNEWNETVDHMKFADNVSFPLKSNKMDNYDSVDKLEKFRALTEHEKSIIKLLPREKSPEVDNLQLQNAIMRRDELRKHKALVKYRENKMRHQNKIKSKKYRKMKKFEEKAILKKLEMNESKEKGVIMLEQAKIDRIKERMSLKHHKIGTSKSMKKKLLLLKNSEIIQDKRNNMDNKKRELSQKFGPTDLEHDVESISNPNNSVEHISESTEYIALDVESQNVAKLLGDKMVDKNLKIDNSIKSPKNVNIEKHLDRKIKIRIDTNRAVNNERMPIGVQLKLKNDELIQEAFADDDVFEDFQEMKDEQVNKEQIKDIDLTLPGWGCWGGPGCEIEPKRRIIVTAPKQKRKDVNMSHVFLSNKKNENIRKHQITKLPYPYSKESQFTENISIAIGKDWNPQSSFKKLTKPKIVTKLGKIIQPLSEKY